MLAVLTLPMFAVMLVVADLRAPRGPSPGVTVATVAGVSSVWLGSMAGWQRYPAALFEVWTSAHDLLVGALVVTLVIAWNVRIAGRVQRAGHTVLQPLAALAVPTWGVPSFFAYILNRQSQAMPGCLDGEEVRAVQWGVIGVAGASLAAVACVASLGWGVLLERRGARSGGFADPR